MIESIKRDEGIRLADGRIVTLSAVRFSETKCEVMLLDPESGEEVTSMQSSTVDEALADFRHIRNHYHTPEPKGRYKKLTEDLKAALAYGLEQAGDDDGGTSNFDAPSISLPGWERKKVEATAKTAGLGCFVWNLWGSKSYVFSIQRGVGQGNTRTKAAEAMREYLKDLGYDATIYCQSD